MEWIKFEGSYETFHKRFILIETVQVVFSLWKLKKKVACLCRIRQLWIGIPALSAIIE